MEVNAFANVFDTNDSSGQNVFGGDAEEPMWEALIGKIIDGDVIPIIGPGILTNDVNIHRELIDFIAKGFNVQSKPQSFSELVYDENYMKANEKRGGRESIYTWINMLFAPDTAKQKPSDILVNLLSSKLFPFVITTSFTPIVEQVMREVWKDDLRVMNFNNNPQENDDVLNESDLKKPTVFYMFGKVGDGRAHRYVVTDRDMLEFCSSWLDESKRPRRLVDCMKGKFLLMIGIDYSDWLFRFIWYSIRKERERKEDMSDMIANADLEESFVHFMERNRTYMKCNPDDVIGQIISRMEAKYAADPLLRTRIEGRVTTKFSYPEENIDVFISYSRSDTAIVERLYEELTKRGLNVWYDRMNLTDGGKFMDEIKRAINSARYFVPVLSLNVEREKDDVHVYRNEWETACGVGIGRTFIIPVSDKDFDFYHAYLPEKIQSHNAISYVSEDDIPGVADKIMNIIQSKG